MKEFPDSAHYLLSTIPNAKQMKGEEQICYEWVKSYLCFDSTQLKEAQQHFLYALKLTEDSGKRHYEGKICIQLARLYCIQDLYPEAERYARRSIDIIDILRREYTHSGEQNKQLQTLLDNEKKRLGHLTDKLAELRGKYETQAILNDRFRQENRRLKETLASVQFTDIELEETDPVHRSQASLSIIRRSGRARNNNWLLLASEL